MQQTASDVLQLVRTMGARLAGHWPTLLALTLAGFTAKLAILKLALLAGEVGWALGVLVFAFTAPILLVAIMVMFRVLSPSRQWPPFTTVLVPFLLIYLYSQHFDGYQVSPALERPVSMDIAAASVLAGLIVVRWLMPLWAAVNSQRWAAWVRLGLDIAWISLLAFTIATHPLSRWLADLAAPVSWVFSAIFAVLVIPAAWLAVGALSTGARPLDLPDIPRRASVPLTLATCLLILVGQLIPLLLWQIERLIIGAQDPQTFWLPLSGVLGAANSAVGVVLVVSLVAAFLDRLRGHETGVTGQRRAAHDSDSDGRGVGGRHEEDGHLIGA